MNDLTDICIAFHGRKYPAGYGFALEYLNQHTSPDLLSAMRNAAFIAVPGQAIEGNPDAPAFVAAFTASRDWRNWLIEAAQLVLSAALAGNARARDTLHAWGHPGY